MKSTIKFTIDGTEVDLSEMGEFAAEVVKFCSEADQERFGRDVSFAIYNGIARKVQMNKGQKERARVRKLWIKANPPNFSGYYYCHIGGEWVHESCSQLDHITPSSVEKIDTDEPGWMDKLRMSCGPHNMQKGSRQDIPSATLEIAPPDGEM